jgi:hypothetical protein
LGFTTPLRVVATNQPSQPITVQLQDNKGNVVAATSAVTLNLNTFSSTGKFFDTSGNPLPTSPLGGSSISIAAGANSASFEYEDSQAIIRTISVNASGSFGPVSAQQSVYVGQPMAITTPVQTLAAGTPSQPITIQLESAATSDVTINLSSSSTGGQFLDTSGNPLPNNSITIVAGASSGSFEYKDSQIGLPTITAAKSDFSAFASQQENVGVSLNITTSPQTVGQGQLSQPITIQLQDSSGKPFAPTSSVFVQLQSSNGGQFFDTSGDPLFSLSIAAGASSASFEYKNQSPMPSGGTDAITATITASGGSSTLLSATQQVTITAPPLEIVSPRQTIAAGQPSQPITVQLQTNGSALTATTNVTINLSSSSSTGRFLDTSGNPLSNNSITIAAGSSSASFEYEDSQEWTPTLTASVSGSGASATQQENIGGVSLVFASAAQTVAAGQASGTIKLQFQDSSGNAVNVPSDTSISFTSNSQTGKFLDTTGKPLSFPDITVSKGSSSASFEYEDSVAGKPTLTAFPSSIAFTGISSNVTQEETVTGPYNVAFTTPVQTIATNQASQPITVSLHDSTGNPATATSAVVVSLSSSSSGGQFLDTSGKPLANNSITIAAGSGSASFEYKDSQTGLPTLTASENGLSGQQTENVGVSLIFTTSPQTLSSGQTSQTVTVQLQDSSGHAFNAPGNMTVNLSSDRQGVQFFDVSGNDLSTFPTITIAAGSSSASFEFKSAFGGTPTLTATARSSSTTAGSLVTITATQKETVQGLAALVFTTSAQTLTAGQTSGIVTVQLEDNNGNAANAPTGGGLTLGLSGGTLSSSFIGSSLLPTSFFDANGKPLPTVPPGLASITIPGGSSTVSFEFEGTEAGTLPINATVPNGFFVSQNESIQVGTPHTVAFVTPAPSLLAGTPSGSITVQLKDQFGNVISAGSGGLTFSLSSSSSGGQFLSVSGDPLPSASITIPQGASSATFEYEDSQSGTPTLTVSASGVSGTQQLTITPASAEIHVSNTNDSGAGSLRAAITAADNNPGSTIVFGTGVTGTIDLLSELPNITANSNILGPGTNVLTIERGASATGAFGGFAVGTPATAAGGFVTPPQPIVTISGLTVANFDGTGITNFGSLTLRKVNVSNNQAPAHSRTNVGSIFDAFGSPGGIGNASSFGFFGGGTAGSLTVLDSTIANNSTTNNLVAAGIDSESGSVIVLNSTIAGNVDINSNSAGGIGIYGGTAFIGNSTISGNTATQASQGNMLFSSRNNSGGGIDSDGNVTLYDTIVAGNTGSLNNPTDVSGTFNSLGHNLIGKANTQSKGFVGTDQLGTTTSPIDPKLGALANNGGPTPTMVLSTGSPAIGAGSSANAPATDQRGEPRPTQGAIDIGAFEVTGVTGHPISLTPATLPAGTVGTSYRQSITASGGSGTLSLTDNVPSNTLGLTFSISGSALNISGTPTATGSVAFTVTGSDTSGDTTGAVSYTLQVNAASPITLGPSSGPLTPGTVGASYNQSISVSGGSGTLSLATNLSASSLPPGLSFSISGSKLTISGTPTTTGSVNFTVTGSDSNGDTTGAVSYSLTVNAAPLSLSPGNGPLPSSTVGVAYSQSITASGGVGTLSLSTTPTTLSLPAGLGSNINGSTLTISGTPTATGNASFSVTVTDANGHTLTQNYTLTVSTLPPPPPPAPPSPAPSAPPAPPVVNPPPLLGFLNSLFGGGTVTVNADGSETVTDSFAGIPLFVSTFDASGHLVSVDLFGFIDITLLFLLL